MKVIQSILHPCLITICVLCLLACTDKQFDGVSIHEVTAHHDQITINGAVVEEGIVYGDMELEEGHVIVMSRGRPYRCRGNGERFVLDRKVSVLLLPKLVEFPVNRLTAASKQKLDETGFLNRHDELMLSLPMLFDPLSCKKTGPD